MAFIHTGATAAVGGPRRRRIRHSDRATHRCFRPPTTPTTPARVAVLRASLPATDLASLAGSALASAGSNVTGISILAGIVVVHEMGHYLAARWQGIRVKNFSVGFGPTLLSYTPEGSETEFTLRAIPFGGFVAFPDPGPPADEAKEADSDATSSSDTASAAAPKATPTLITTGDAGADQQPQPSQKQETTIDPDDPNLLQNRPVFDRIVVISAGVIANILFAWGALFASVTLVGQPSLSFLPGSVISAIPSPSTSMGAQAGLRVGDLLRAIDGVEISAAPDSAQAAARTIRGSNGQSLRLEVERDGELFPLEVTPRCCQDNGDALLGVTLATNTTVSREKPAGPVQAVQMTNSEFWRILSRTVAGQIELVRNFGKQIEEVAGPIGVVSMGADIARRDSNGLYLFTAAISINLAIINALPLPALDGGQLVFLLIEGVSGKPVPSKYQNAINQSFLAVLAFLSIELLLKDVSRLVPFLNSK